MVQFERVSVVYTSGQHALADLSMHIRRGEFVYVLGRSGAGKSTLLRLLYADIMPSSGIVKINSDDITFLPQDKIPHLRRQVGVIFQDFNLIDDMSVFNNVRLALDIYFFKKSGARERIWPILKQLDIFELRDALAGSLSGGEKQRVAIARALVNEPKIIVADEPTGNLDAENARNIMGMLWQARANGATVIMATHDKLMVEEYPDRQITLDRGRIVEDKP